MVRAVGFDLDLTLVDPRVGVEATLVALGVPADEAAAAAQELGPPLEEMLARWWPADSLPEVGERYRAIYAREGPAGCVALPGAAEALVAARARGGRVVVVTAKRADLAAACLAACGLTVDAVHGWLWGEAKARALRAEGADIFVGDHALDVVGARAAGAVAVLVAPPGPPPAGRSPDADVHLADLTEFTGWLSEHDRVQALLHRLAALGRVLVAFSGGTDSAFLLAAAVRALGPHSVCAATAVSPSLPAAELRAAAAFAAGLGVAHLTPGTEELTREGYRANGADRCFFCKAELLDVLTPLAARHGCSAVLTGTNADDLVAGFRPGIRAAAERGALTPLADAGLTKAQVRAASRRWGLATWDKPAAACLASRIAYGVTVTPARLARVERAEVTLRAALTRAGVAPRNLRVRDLGDVARVELDAELLSALPAAVLTAALAEIAEPLGTGGFVRVELDPRGFRSGSMNEALAHPGGAADGALAG
ncbi:MAG: ATP-dependent sacrificial sulfur transferase LarE [Mycobacteriales bacterium]